MYSNMITYLKTPLQITLLFIALMPHTLYAEVVMIVNPANNANIDQVTIKKIFLGRSTTFENGEKAIPVELATGNLRESFIEHILQKDKSSLNSHWSRMIFTGKGRPPRTFNTEDEIKNQVANNISVIGFIDSSHVDNTVKVLKLN